MTRLKKNGEVRKEKVRKYNAILTGFVCEQNDYQKFETWRKETGLKYFSAMRWMLKEFLKDK